MKIELFYFEGCPNHEPTEQLLREVMAELGIDAEITAVNVATEADAIARKFLGSPSVRINGRDLEIEEDESTPYSMRCRVYHGRQGLSGVPPMQMIKAALLKALPKP
jgi:hypothetical protein